MHFQAGLMRLHLRDDGWPTWIDLEYENKVFHGMNVSDLKDLEYVVKRALEEVADKQRADKR